MKKILSAIVGKKNPFSTFDLNRCVSVFLFSFLSGPWTALCCSLLCSKTAKPQLEDIKVK